MRVSFAPSFFAVAIIFMLAASFAVVLPYAHAGAETIQEQRARLQAELDEIEKDIAEKRGVLSEKQAERTSLERDMAILDAQIEKAQLEIRHRDITLKQLSSDIYTKREAIQELDAKVKREQEGLARLLRQTQEIDDLTLVELALGGSLSELFVDIDNFQTIQKSIDISFDELAALRDDLSNRKRVLEEQHEEESDLRQIQVLEKQSIERKEAEKNEILTATKGEEEAYKMIIAEREKTAAEIRATLFSLRDTAAIPFGDAYQFAKEASNRTNVRPAVILAILAEESNLGENVGTGSWQVDMHPTRDRPVFEQLTALLGLDPDLMPVSKKPWYGWGGAMGPAQFIPSTWVCYGGLINTRTNDCSNGKRSLGWDDFWQGPWTYEESKDRVRRVSGGSSMSSPWNPRTAIFAAAILMMDNGADKGTWEAERLAALRYFAGWGNANKSAYAFYGDDVMELAATFQRQIDILEGA